MAQVTKDMLIAEVLQTNENMANILMREGMHCIGCPAISLRVSERLLWFTASIRTRWWQD